MSHLDWIILQAVSVTLVGSVSFGLWMRSWMAGVWMVCVLSGLYEISVTIVRMVTQVKGCV